MISFICEFIYTYMYNIMGGDPSSTNRKIYKEWILLCLASYIFTSTRNIYGTLYSMETLDYCFNFVNIYVFRYIRVS